MKNQYFADVRDYTKYYILRQFPEIPKIIYWMLTKDDNGVSIKDNNEPCARYKKERRYLKSKQCVDLDSELCGHLSTCVDNCWRDVSHIEGLLGEVVHYEKSLIDDWAKREAISNDVISMASKDQIVFLDPDNGYQVPSCPEGGRRSSKYKYVYESEIRRLLEKDVTIILFQHLRRGQAVDKMIQEFSEQFKCQYRFAVRTSYAVYYFLSKNSDLDWARRRLIAKCNDKPHTRLKSLMLKSETAIKFAKMVLSPNGIDDLDCAGWELQEVLALDPENAEAAALLKDIIARIDQRFDAGDGRGTGCHITIKRESPSPYVRAKERVRSSK